MRFTKGRERCNLSSIENRRVQTGRERIAYTKSLSEISCTSPEMNAATYVDLPDSTLWKRLIIWTRSRLNRKKTPSKEGRGTGWGELSNRGCASFDWLSWPRGDSCCYQVLPVPSVRSWLFKELLPFNDCPLSIRGKGNIMAWGIF